MRKPNTDQKPEPDSPAYFGKTVLLIDPDDRISKIATSLYRQINFTHSRMKIHYL